LKTWARRGHYEYGLLAYYEQLQQGKIHDLERTRLFTITRGGLPS
jgi:hypothetical protein